MQLKHTHSVQRLRQRLAMGDDRGRSRVIDKSSESEHRRLRSENIAGGIDRTPSFFTSRSIVHLSGLGVSDPSIPNVSDSPISLKHGVEKQDAIARNLDVMMPENGERIICNETLSEGINKTTSMADFYYKKSKSEDDIRSSLS